MCTRMCSLTIQEANAVLNARGSHRHALDEQDADAFDPTRDAYPGSQVPVYIPMCEGGLAVVTLNWGFPLEDKKTGNVHSVVNTRLETALAQMETGQGMWAHAIREGRCLIPVRAFYESHATERVESERTGKPVRRQYRFTLPGAQAFLLAGIQEDGHVSVVTTEPNSVVAPVHNRMPLVLGPGESSMWLGANFAQLADRSMLRLNSTPER